MKIKQFIKRAVSLVAACALLVSNTSVFTAFAADSVPTIYAEEVDAMPGDTVDIHVSVKNNPGFVSMQIVATYDPNVLTLKDTTLEAAGMNDNSAPVEEADGEYWIDFSNDTARKDNTADGSVYTLTFQVNNNAAVKSYSVTLQFNYGLNYNEDMLSFVAQDTAVNVICKHAALKAVAAKTETCTENGNISYWYCPTCDKCFKDAEAATEIKKAETIIAAHHTMKQVPAKDATCESEGNIAYYTCSVCGKLFSDADAVTETTADAVKLEKLSHKLTKTEAVPATCTKGGSNEYYTCSACGKIFKDADASTETSIEAEKTSKIPHSLTKTEYKAATCTEDGNTEYYTCSACGKIFKDESGTQETSVEAEKLVATGHSLTKTDAKEPTCTEDGNNEYYTCSACGKVFKDADGKTETSVEAEKIAATGHTMTKTDAKAATCTEDGNTAYWHCSVCNKYFSDENGSTEIALPNTVVKAHHTMTKTDAKEPTCTAEGNNAYYTCSVCGKVFKDEAGTQPTTVKAETLKKKAHTPVVDAAVAATCAKTGLTEGSHCSVCNEVLVAQKVVDKIPHTVVVDAAVEPTYSSTGLTEGKHCSVCNEVIEKQTVIPAKSESNVTVIGGESFAGSKKELADAVLSAEDIENINNGKDITIRLNVALKSDATDAIKEQVKAKLKDYTIGTFYDIDISKSIDGGAPVAVTDTNAPVHIQLTLADSLINTDTTVKRDYKIIRFHYDSVTGQTVVDILDASYHAGYNKLDFNTDKFSVYAVVYKDTKMAPAPTATPGNSNSGNSANTSAETSPVTGKVCPICGYNNCKLGNDNRWHCGKCAHSWQEYGQAGSTSSTGNAPKSPKTGLF